MPAQPEIIYTKVDEAPELASASFLPIYPGFYKTSRYSRRHEGYFACRQNHRAIS